MMDLADILSSSARFRILKCLTQQPEALPLRQIASLTNLPVRSIELGLRGLVKDRILKSRHRARNHLFWLRDDHPQSFTIRYLFQALSQLELQKRAQGLKVQADRAISFADSVKSVFKTT